MGKRTTTLKSIFLNEEDWRAKGLTRGSPDTSTLQSRPPQPTPRSGQTGQPSSSPTMSYNRIAKNTMTDDDIEYWMGDPDDEEDVGATFDPPYDVGKFLHHSNYGNPNDQRFGEGEEEDLINKAIVETKIKQYVRSVLEYKKGFMGTLETHAGLFQGRGRDGKYHIYKHIPSQIIIGVIPAHDGYYAYNFENDLSFTSDTLEGVLARSVEHEEDPTEIGEFEDHQDAGLETDEASSVGGGSISGYIAPLGTDGKSPYLKKKKSKGNKKKHYEPTMRAFGGAKEVD